MFGIHNFGLFLATAVALNLTPGQDTFYIVGRTISQGRSAGIASVLGIATGSVIHTLAAALGLSALLAASASAFFAIKLAGAIYLIYLGIRLLLTRAPSASIPADFSSVKIETVYRQGFITNVLNPKVALFFLALMPQFIASDSANKFSAFITLGLCFVTTGTIWCFCLTLMASQVRERLRKAKALTEILNRLAGAIFVALGIRLATTR
jgi:threonine/homoserine/homoserine lactone efflux protein